MKYVVCLIRTLVSLQLALPVWAEPAAPLPERHHLVNIDIPERMTIPDSFPLNENRQLSCFACHDDEKLKKWEVSSTSTALTLDDLNVKSDDFIREGPYRLLTDFCYRCHEPEANQRPNLHVMLDEQNKIIEKQCTYCHKEVPSRDKPNNENLKDNVALRLPADKLCYGCHLKTPHLNAGLHQVKANKAMQKRILTYAKQQQIKIPLGDDGQIRCTTCHASHQKGVLDVNSPAGRQAGQGDLEKGVHYQTDAWSEVVYRDKQQRLAELGNKTMLPEFKYQCIEHEELLRLPAKDGTLCLVCHQFEH